MEINIPCKMERTIKEKVRISIERYAKQENVEEEWSYVIEHFDKHMERIQRRTPEWPSPIAPPATIIYQALCGQMRGDRELKEDSTNLLIAAVYYFCYPRDVIADWSPEDGYFDDAYALNFCLKQIEKTDRRGFYFLERLYKEHLDANR